MQREEILEYTFITSIYWPLAIALDIVECSLVQHFAYQKLISTLAWTWSWAMWLRHVAKYYKKVMVCGKPDSTLEYPNASLVSRKSLDPENRQSMTHSLVQFPITYTWLDLWALVFTIIVLNKLCPKTPEVDSHLQVFMN